MIWGGMVLESGVKNNKIIKVEVAQLQFTL